ncbi:MAG: carboxypeptidase-like regulatory domain-containing protein, partial [Prevotella sp.]|nr:carboxypeptidase-like regulatory domain-containing protein [Prevotella sp.]
MKLKSFIERTNYRTCLLFLIALLAIPHLSAQNQGIMKVKGTVIENGTRETIIGASITVKGTTAGTISDDDGNFDISVSRNAVLVISYLGFKTKEVPVDGQSQLSIILEEDMEMLEEIVVIGYGQVRKGDATGSLTAIKPDEL